MFKSEIKIMSYFLGSFSTWELINARKFEFKIKGGNSNWRWEIKKPKT